MFTSDKDPRLLSYINWALQEENIQSDQYNHAGYRAILEYFPEASKSEAQQAAREAKRIADSQGAKPSPAELEAEACLPEQFQELENIPEDWEDILNEIIRHQEFLKQHEYARSEAEFVIETEEPIVLMVRGDAHLCNSCTDHKLWKEHHELVLQKDYLYEINAGDNTDGAIKTYMKDLVQEQLVRPKIQRELWRRAYSPLALAGKLVAIVHGQHDGSWSSSEADYNPVEEFAKEYGLNYLGPGGLLHLRVGEQTYEILLRHKFPRSNSSKNPEHSVRQMIRQHNTSVDIGIVADKHTSACAPHYEGGHHYWVARPSSYKIQDSFAREKGYAGQPTVMPAFMLYPEEKKILGFEQVEAAVEVYESMFRAG